MALIYDVYIMCQENAFRDYESYILDQIQSCLPTYTRKTRYGYTDLYFLEWHRIKDWSRTPSQTTREINVIREWVYDYVNRRRPVQDGDGMSLICICEGSSVVESASNYVDSMPSDFYAEMQIHRPEDLEWEVLYSIQQEV